MLNSYLQFKKNEFHKTHKSNSIVQFKRLLLLPIIFSLFACSGGKDNRQTVSSSNLGVIFFAKIKTIYQAKGESTDPVYNGVFNGYTSQRGDNLSPLKGAQYVLREAIGSAIGVDIERRIAATRCIYIIKIKDKDISRFVETTVLNGFESGFDSDEESEEDSDEDSRRGNNVLQQEFENFERALRQRNTDQYLESNDSTRTEEKRIRKYINVAQSCDKRLAPNLDVMLTLNEDGATIHPLNQTMKNIRDDRDN